MKLLQYRGPFVEGDIIEVLPRTDYSYVHIGIQIPDRQPIGSVNEYSLPLTGDLVDLNINGMDYRISHSILEFSDLAEIKWEIEILVDLPAETIIDLLYDDNQETI